MRAVSNTFIAILGIVILVALVVYLELHIRRSTIHSLARLRQTRLAANDALRRRLASKLVTGVEKRTQELERTGECPDGRVGGRGCIPEGDSKMRRTDVCERLGRRAV
jgi:sensor domain CHASE-containing protein